MGMDDRHLDPLGGVQFHELSSLLIIYTRDDINLCESQSTSGFCSESKTTYMKEIFVDITYICNSTIHGILVQWFEAIRTLYTSNVHSLLHSTSNY